MHYFHNPSSASGALPPYSHWGSILRPRWRNFVSRPIICPPLENILPAPIARDVSLDKGVPVKCCTSSGCSFQIRTSDTDSISGPGSYWRTSELSECSCYFGVCYYLHTQAYTQWYDGIMSLLRRRIVGKGDLFYLKFWVNRPPLEQNRRFWTDNPS